LAQLGQHYTGIFSFMAYGVMGLPFWLAMGGLASAWYLYEKRPDLPEMIQSKCKTIYSVLINKYGFDDFYAFFFAGGARGLGKLLWNFGDIKLIDGLLVNGTARTVVWFSGIFRHIQTGYLYHYAFAMIIGLLALVLLFAR